ncbi:MAG: hypothetical protein Q8S84_06070 [bacterium]|nr:hypothetical protein [bacterium]MDP3381045.1 hypothetical protein [bacterium]
MIFTPLVGSGYFPDSISYNSNQVLIIDISLNLTASLDCSLYHCKLIKAITHNIANIAITTISSTKVKACLLICNPLPFFEMEGFAPL